MSKHSSMYKYQYLQWKHLYPEIIYCSKLGHSKIQPICKQLCNNNSLYTWEFIRECSEGVTQNLLYFFSLFLSAVWRQSQSSNATSSPHTRRQYIVSIQIISSLQIICNRAQYNSIIGKTSLSFCSYPPVNKSFGLPIVLCIAGILPFKQSRLEPHIIAQNFENEVENSSKVMKQASRQLKGRR